MIKNISRNNMLAEESRICSSIFSKARGLMFSRRIKDRGLVFVFNKEDRWSLHMFFVFFPIDVLWLNKDNRVVDLKENFRPFELLAKPKDKAKYIIELPAETIKNSNTRLGDKVLF